MLNIDAIVKNGVQQAESVNPSTVSPGKINYDEMYKAARVRPTDTIEADPVVIWVKDEPSPVQFGTLGNFSMITGKAKSKKSFTLCLAVAPAIDGSQYNVGPFDVKLPADKPRVLYFDTEQGKYRVWKAIKRVCRMAGVENPPQIEYFDLRNFNTHERVEFIRLTLNDRNPQKDIGLVIIDGCRDLIHDINDPKDATQIATLLMQWTANNGLHIITVLHQNKGDNNARGHVGTELINKAETVISVEVDKDDTSVSIVKPEQTRAEGFNGFAFNINADGLPQLLPDYELNGKAAASKKAFNPFDYQPETHHGVLSKVFATGPIKALSDYIEALKIEWLANGVKLADNTAKLCKSYYQKMGWVTNKSEPGKKAVYEYQNKDG